MSPSLNQLLQQLQTVIAAIAMASSSPKVPTKSYATACSGNKRSRPDDENKEEGNDDMEVNEKQGPPAQVALPSLFPPIYTPGVEQSNNVKKMKSFISSKVVQLKYKQVLHHWHDVNNRLAKAKQSLQRMSSVSMAAHSGSDPNSVHIPKSLRITMKVSLGKNKDKPDLYKEEEEAIKTLLQTAEMEVMKQVASARQKEVDHLSNQAQPAVFLQAATAEYSKFVAEHVSKIAAILGPDSIFPTLKVIEHFALQLHTHIETSVSNQQLEQKAAKEQQEKEGQKDLISQEQVLDGAFNGKTISQIAQREVKTNFQKFKNDIIKIVRHEISQSTAPAHPAKKSNKTPSGQAKSAKPKVQTGKKPTGGKFPPGSKPKPRPQSHSEKKATSFKPAPAGKDRRSSSTSKKPWGGDGHYKSDRKTKNFSKDDDNDDGWIPVRHGRRGKGNRA